MVASPSVVEGGFAGVGQAERMGGADVQAFDLEMEPLKVRASRVRPNGQADPVRVAGVQNLDVAAVEICADGEGHGGFLCT